MKLKDLKKLSPYITILDKAADGPWVVKKIEPETPRGFISGNEINKKNAKAHAAELNSALLVEKRGPDEYVIIGSDLNKSFLTGLADAAGIVEDVLQAHKNETPAEKIRWSVMQLDAWLSRQKRSLRPKPSVLGKVIKPLTVKSLSRYDKNAEIKDSGLFKLSEVLALSTKTAFLDKKDRKYYYYSKHKAAARGLGTWETACRQAVDDMQCNIIALKVSTNMYKIVYADTGKNYLRGAIAAASALKNIHLAPYIPASKKLKVFNEQLIKYANIARIDLGYKELAINFNPKYCNRLNKKDKVRLPGARERV